MVLQAEMRNVIAQAEQEVVVTIMRGAEKSAGLLHQIAVFVPDLLRRLERGGAVSGDVHLHGRSLALIERNNLHVFARNDRGVDQRIKRYRREVNFVSRLR